MRLNARHAAPREDALGWDDEGGVIAATDGVTRDWEAIRQGLRPYPDPSPATDAADAAAAALVEALSGGAAFPNAFAIANAAVAEVNARWDIPRRCDYLEHDFAGAVAAAVRLEGRSLQVGWIGDCGVAVIRDGALLYLTRDQLDEVNAHLRANPAPFGDDRRVAIRRDLRNRPSHLHKGRPVTYGVLTGEPEALHYVEIATLDLLPGDVVCVHTDGFRPHFARAEFLAALAAGADAWKSAIPSADERLNAESGEYGRERSLAALQLV
ncbi:MAG TPA: protein phosphatase 2C domain-containing protein [Armatimonadota bacterium]